MKEGWMKNDKWWMKDDDFKLLRGFADEWTDICDCRVAFATENRIILPVSLVLAAEYNLIKCVLDLVKLEEDLEVIYCTSRSSSNWTSSNTHTLH